LTIPTFRRCVGSSSGQPIEPVLRVSALKCDIFTFDPSQLAEAIAESELRPGCRVPRACAEKLYFIGLFRLLRPRAQRPRCGHDAKHGNELATPHAITSSRSNCARVILEARLRLACPRFVLAKRQKGVRSRHSARGPKRDKARQKLSRLQTVTLLQFIVQCDGHLLSITLATRLAR
jgi:hypothetical protein